MYAGSDTQATALVLAEALKRLRPDFVFCGRQSVDGDTAQVPPMLAQRLGFAIRPKVIEFDSKRITLRSGETFAPKEKTVLTFEKIKTLRFPSIFSKLGEVEVWDNSKLQIAQEKCGLKGSPTRVFKSYESSVGRRNCQFVGMEILDALIQKGLQKQRVEQSQDATQKLNEIYFVGDVKGVAERIAKRAIELKVDGKSAEALAQELQENNVKTVLWEDSEAYKILASQVAVLTAAGICADCISFYVHNGKLVMTRPALGGNVTADILCESELAFATVRTAQKEGADVIFSVGKGAVGELDNIKRLAQKYNAEISCSRVVADSGKLPYEKQVGYTLIYDGSAP